MLACFKSAFEYLTEKSYSWKQLEELTGYKPDRAAWTVKIWTEMSDTFDVRMIEGFDYKRYYKEGKAYLFTFLKPKEVEWQLRESNLAEIRPLVPDFLKKVSYEQRSPQLTDIDEMLKDDRLVFVQLNSNALDEKPGYVAHMVLVHGKNGDSYIAHDPGPPATANRNITPELLLKAMGGEDTTVEVTGIKLKHGK